MAGLVLELMVPTLAALGVNCAVHAALPAFGVSTLPARVPPEALDQLPVRPVLVSVICSFAGQLPPVGRNVAVSGDPTTPCEPEREVVYAPAVAATTEY